ncbi:MAG: class I tRNA ligase family protein, partial [Clostridia bacterium]|nr:class I tRNA ligase family protein [Clostridia bacterium]
MHVGMAAFNDECHKIVSANNDSWREYVTEMARWVDYDNAYKTMNPSFMESVMWAFKTCYDKGYIYRDFRVTPYCTHCETSLSISDTRESDSTRPRQDRWIIGKFRSTSEANVNGKPVSYLAWTTTPWTLPSNLCLAVGEKLTYAYVDVGEEIFVACKNILGKFKNVFGAEPVIVKEVSGADLVGNTYEPIFPYFADMKEKGAFVIVTADYVDDSEGVGIVHTAPAFGEDDYWTCKKHGIPMVNPVDAKGHFTQEITDFYEEGLEKTVIEMNPVIIRFLYEQNKAVADGTIEHNYPHCWRCKRPLIYKAMDAWYFNIDMLKDRLIETNEQINWIPETVKHGRFGQWLQNARDWNISRNRYWSTPIPIWECECCGKRVVLGSVAEIEEKSGIHLTDLHRQYMDLVTFPCECGHTMRRVPEVLDCWFESGSVTFAQKHYPFENKDWFETHFPCDF